MTFRTLCALAAAAFIGTTTMSMAATLTSTGATGVDVDGTLYDVAFVDGSCISVFTGCNSPSDFFFTNRFSAGDAAQALLDLFNAPGNEQFTISPNLISGCAASAVCSVLTPYDGFIFFNEPNVSVATFENNDVSSGQFANNIPDGTYRETFFDATFDTTNNASGYAVWSDAAVVPVPLPASALLLLAGFGGLALNKRRKKPTA